MARPITIFAGDIYHTNNYGSYTVLAYHNKEQIDIEFLDTGYRTTVHNCQIRNGKIRDPNVPTVAGIGCLGDGIYTTHIFLEDGSRQTNPVYTKWVRMVTRMSKGLMPVDQELLNFQTFAAREQDKSE